MENLHRMPVTAFSDHDDASDDLLCEKMVIGMAYVPVQKWENLMEPEEALSRGTQFRDLDKPFFGEDVWGCN